MFDRHDLFVRLTRAVRLLDLVFPHRRDLDEDRNLRLVDRLRVDPDLQHVDDLAPLFRRGVQLEQLPDRLFVVRRNIEHVAPRRHRVRVLLVDVLVEHRELRPDRPLPRRIERRSAHLNVLVERRRELVPVLRATEDLFQRDVRSVVARIDVEHATIRLDRSLEVVARLLVNARDAQAHLRLALVVVGRDELALERVDQVVPLACVLVQRRQHFERVWIFASQRQHFVQQAHRVVGAAERPRGHLRLTRKQIRAVDVAPCVLCLLLEHLVQLRSVVRFGVQAIERVERLGCAASS